MRGEQIFGHGRVALSRILRYFLPYFHIGELLLRISAQDRAYNLKRSRSKLEQYFKQLDAYDILVREDARLYERYQDNPDTFSTASTTDAAARRHTKITRFKEEKAMKQKLEVSRRILPSATTA